MMADLIKSLGCTLRRVAITSCENRLFFSRLHAVNDATNAFIDLDARPSDAINLAVRHGAPVYVRNNVIERYATKEDK